MSYISQNNMTEDQLNTVLAQFEEAKKRGEFSLSDEEWCGSVYVFIENGVTYIGAPVEYYDEYGYICSDRSVSILLK